MLLTYDLPASPVNGAVDAILARLAELVDLNGRTLFHLAERGADMSRFPTEQTPVAVRLWHDSLSASSRSVQMFTGEWRAVISLYLYFYVPTLPGGGFGRLQETREELVRYMMTQLEYPDDGRPTSGLDPGASWRFELPAVFDIDHTSALKRFGSFLTSAPPWYVTRVDFRIIVYDKSRVSNG